MQGKSKRKFPFLTDSKKLTKRFRDKTRNNSLYSKYNHTRAYHMDTQAQGIGISNSQTCDQSSFEGDTSYGRYKQVVFIFRLICSIFYQWKVVDELPLYTEWC
jgi:hypothetical protein